MHVSAPRHADAALRAHTDTRAAALAAEASATPAPTPAPGAAAQARSSAPAAAPAHPTAEFRVGMVFAPRSATPEPGALPPGSRLYPPIQRGEQGLTTNEARHGDQLMQSLLQLGSVHFVSTYHHDQRAYEIRGRDGSISFQRYQTPDGQLRFSITDVKGQPPIPSMDPSRLSTLAQIHAASGGPGRAVPADATSYPDIFARMSQLFDHRDAPDVTFAATPGGSPAPGMHSSPEVVQSRAPLIIAGPGVARGAVTDAYASIEDIAPTAAEYLGVDRVEGIGPAGVPRRQLLSWQDGDSLSPALRQAEQGTRTFGAADRVMMFVLDGANHAVLHDEIARGNLPNIERLTKQGTTFQNGLIAQYPSVTWANHATLNTGVAPGHHGILNNSWYARGYGRVHDFHTGLRDQPKNGRALDRKPETIYEAVERTWGKDALTISANQPPGARGADISTLDVKGWPSLLRHPIRLARNLWEGRNINDDALAAHDPDYRRKSRADNLAVSSVLTLIDAGRTPKYATIEIASTDEQGHHHGPESEEARAALREADAHIGRVIDRLEKRGQLDSTMMVVTGDHGMGGRGGDDEPRGGWSRAIRRSGVSVRHESRFLYINSMDVSASARPMTPTSSPSSGVAAEQHGWELTVQVRNDDKDARGQHPPVTAATVRVLDDAGREMAAGTTNESGLAQVTLPAGSPSTVRVVVEHDEFTSEEHHMDLSRREA